LCVEDKQNLNPCHHLDVVPGKLLQNTSLKQPSSENCFKQER